MQILDNHHLFQLINAPAGLGSVTLWLANALAEWLINLIPVAMVVAWVRGDAGSRHELLQMLLAVLFALAIGQLLAFLWPQPRPAELHLGHQYLQHSADPGLPSDHVTVFWSLAFAALVSVFVLTWSATRLGYSSKSRLGVAERREGRKASQVLANLAVAGLCAMVFAVNHRVAFLMGVVAALTEAGLPAHQAATALLSFNIGVEVVQASLILITIPILTLLATKKPKFYAPATMVCVGLISLAGAFWFVERIVRGG